MYRGLSKPGNINVLMVLLFHQLIVPAAMNINLTSPINTSFKTNSILVMALSQEAKHEVIMALVHAEKSTMEV